MAVQKKKATEVLVEDYIEQVKHPLKEAMQALRKIILSTDKIIAEQIKWNSPAFFYSGEMKDFDPKEYKRDLLVFNLHKQDRILLIFPTGASIQNDSGILEGDFKDGRRMITFYSLDEVKKRKKDLQAVIKDWLSKVEK